MARDVLDVRLENAKELDGILTDAVREFGPHNSLAPLRLVLRDALKPLIPLVQRETPVDTGELLLSTRVASYKLRNDATVGAIIGWIDRPNNLVRTPQFLASEFGNLTQVPFGQVIQFICEKHQTRLIAYVQANARRVVLRRMELLARRKKRQGRRFRIR